MKFSKITLVYIAIGALVVIALVFKIIGSQLSILFAKTEKRQSTETIDFYTRNEPDSVLPTGISYVKQTGKAGYKTITTLYTYDKDGKVIKQNVVDEKVTTPATDSIVVVGQATQDSLSKGIRDKAQQFYNSYKDGKYTGASKWLKLVSGADKMPYSDDTIKDAVKDIEFSIKEITVGEPKVQTPFSNWGRPYENLNEVNISADIPLQVKSSSKLSVEKVTDFNKSAYFDVINHEWLFPPIGPVLFAPGSETVHFDPSPSDDKGVGGIIKVEKVIQWVPMTNSNDNFNLVLVFSGKFDNDKNFKRVNFSDVRDDLGNTYWESEATPYSVKNDRESPQRDLIWGIVGTDLKKIYGAKKISLKISEVAIDPITYVFGGGMVIHPKDFTITGISIN